MQVTHEHGLIFNREKCNMKTTSVTFFGTVYDKDGAYPDPKNVEGTPEVLRYDHIPVTVHSFPLNIHHTPVRTTAERFRVHLE